jgi:coenzyme Q-binding protein COQ10
MGVVTSEIEVAVDPQTAFELAREVEKYPDFMPDVDEVKVLERRDDGYTRVSWVGHAKVASIDKLVKWTEEEWWDKDNLTSKFELVEGDYKHYRGDWKFEKSNGGARIKLTVDFDLGLPLIGPMIVKLLDRIMQDNIDGMLKAIKERAEHG